MIEPIFKGNICSRLSHSCIPNSFIYNIIEDSKYYTKMLTTSRIQQFEELTFDYCSITESE